MRIALLLAGVVLMFTATDVVADAFCFKCTSDYRCTSVITNGGCSKEDPDCAEEPTPIGAVGDEEPWRLIDVRITTRRQPVVQYADARP